MANITNLNESLMARIEALWEWRAVNRHGWVKEPRHHESRWHPWRPPWMLSSMNTQELTFWVSKGPWRTKTWGDWHSVKTMIKWQENPEMVDFMLEIIPGHESVSSEFIELTEGDGNLNINISPYGGQGQKSQQEDAWTLRSTMFKKGNIPHNHRDRKHQDRHWRIYHDKDRRAEQMATSSSVTSGRRRTAGSS